MQKDSDKNQKSDVKINLRSGGDGNAVKKSVYQKPADCRIDGRNGNQMVAVHFFAQMEMRRYGVFKKLRQQITRQKQNHRHKKGFA